MTRYYPEGIQKVVYLQWSRAHDLHEAFEMLKQYGMKLNPVKCAFGVSSGKFLCYMVSSRGIEANFDKIQAILEMQSPKTTKQLQQLTGGLAALNRFISRSTDKCLPFFKILRKAFEWSDECEEAFSQLKNYLTSSPLLSRIVPGEVLYLYLAVSPMAISTALIREDKGIQKPVYFVSKALHRAEERYPQIEKLAFHSRYGLKEASAILSSSHHPGPHGIPTQKGDAEA
jgi:hypothetical protein